MTKSTHLSTFIIFILIMSISGCNSELETAKFQLKKLENEIAVLKVENKNLRIENKELKQTAQYHFNQGVDILREAKFVSHYESAKQHFNQIIVKYSSSELVDEAKEFVESIDRIIDETKLTQTVSLQTNKLIKEGKFKQAEELLKKSKNKMLKGQFEAVYASVVEAKNKPVATTVNRLVSNFAKLRNGKSGTVLDMEKLRVKVNIRIVDIDRARLSVKAYGDKTYGEERIEIFYENSNMVDALTDNKVDRYDIYTVTGTIKLYSNGESFYIDADSIKYLERNETL